MLKQKNNKKFSSNESKKHDPQDGISWVKPSGLLKCFLSSTEKVNSPLQTNLELKERIKTFSMLAFAEGFPDDFDKGNNKATNLASNLSLIDQSTVIDSKKHDPQDGISWVKPSGLSKIFLSSKNKVNSAEVKHELKKSLTLPLDQGTSDDRVYNESNAELDCNAWPFSTGILSDNDLLLKKVKVADQSFNENQNQDNVKKTKRFFTIESKSNNSRDGISWASPSGLSKFFLTPEVSSTSQINVELKMRRKNFLALPFTDGLPNDFIDNQIKPALDASFKSFSNLILTDVSTDSNLDLKKVKKLNSAEIKKINFTAPHIVDELLNSLLNGISIGIFLEAVILLLPASPLAQLLPGSIELDNFLIKLLDIKKPFSMGILGGAAGALIKFPFSSMGILGGAAGALIKFPLNKDNVHQILLVLGALLSSLPTKDKQIEKMQLIAQCILLLYLSGKGLVSTIKFLLPYSNKIPNMVSSFFYKITSETVFFFYKKNTKNTKNDVMYVGAYDQPCTRAFR